MGREPISRGVSIAFAAALFAVLVILLAGATRGTAKPPTGTGDGGVALKQIGNFDQPVYTATAPGKANRKLIFVVERGGAVRVIRNGKTLDKPFLDISSLLKVDFAERGLLSIAFDPGYAKNRRFYVYYTAAPDGDVTVAQYRRARNSKVVADPGSAREVISIPHAPAPNHNGGEVTFGPDGNMWLATGDGGAGCDPAENAQNLNSLLGKLLRITPKANGGYTVPHDNPFVNKAGADEVYAYGLRNPFRFSFDADTKAVAIADVGQNAWEEINYLKTAEGRRRQLRLGRLRGQGARSAAGRLPGRHQHPAPRRLDLPGPRLPAFESGSRSVHGLCRDRRAGGPEQASEDPLRPLPVLGLVRRRAAELRPPHRTGRAGDRPLGIGLESTSSIVEGREHRIYATDLAGPVYRIVPARGTRPRLSGGHGCRRHGRRSQVHERGDGRGCFRAKRLGDFSDPVYVIGPQGAKGLRFVVEKAGRILAVGPHGKTSTFLDIRNRVTARR